MINKNDYINLTQNELDNNFKKACLKASHSEIALIILKQVKLKL